MGGGVYIWLVKVRARLGGTRSAGAEAQAPRKYGPCGNQVRDGHQGCDEEGERDERVTGRLPVDLTGQPLGILLIVDTVKSVQTPTLHKHQTSVTAAA